VVSYSALFSYARVTVMVEYDATRAVRHGCWFW